MADVITGSDCIVRMNMVRVGILATAGPGLRVLESLLLRVRSCLRLKSYLGKKPCLPMPMREGDHCPA